MSQLPQLPSSNIQPEKQKPFSAQPPAPSGILPRSDKVIRRSAPVGLTNVNIPVPDSQNEFDVGQYINAHKQLVMRTGKLMPIPVDRDIRVGNVVIPRNIARHIGEWAVPVVADDSVLLKPGERW